MADTDGMSIQPAEVQEISRQLDELANRVQRVMTDEAPNLTVTPSARDEVSQRIAQTLNEVHTSFGTSTDQGMAEVHEVAATLRGHSSNIAASEDFSA
ncbi:MULTISPECIES: PE domain-containing protein [unclassified Mycobacterium]|uniref:PE domain-containing protein n=1 Tax=Mycobacterium sp. DL99 TaxID=2528957 RepID=UPI001081600A|nr:PE domain-containing protein [Mycobacterium sp. DL99]